MKEAHDFLLSSYVALLSLFGPLEWAVLYLPHTERDKNKRESRMGPKRLLLYTKDIQRAEDIEN